MFPEFIVRLYASSITGTTDYSCWDFSTIGDLKTGQLNRLITTLEVKQALFKMDPNKALGPNGFHPRFFHKSGQRLVILLLNLFGQHFKPTMYQYKQMKLSFV